MDGERFMWVQIKAASTFIFIGDYVSVALAACWLNDKFTSNYPADARFKVTKDGRPLLWEIEFEKIPSQNPCLCFRHSWYLLPLFTSDC